MRKNQYEEALFRCEDDRFELDMVIETNASAIRAITPLVQAAIELSPDEKVTWRIPQGAMSPVHFRAIQRIYGDLPFALSPVSVMFCLRAVLS